MDGNDTQRIIGQLQSGLEHVETGLTRSHDSLKAQMTEGFDKMASAITQNAAEDMKRYEGHMDYHQKNEPLWGVYTWMQRNTKKSLIIIFCLTAGFSVLYSDAVAGVVDFFKANWFRFM